MLKSEFVEDIFHGKELRLVAYDETGMEVDKIKRIISVFRWVNYYRSPHPDRKYDFITIHICPISITELVDIHDEQTVFISTLMTSPLEFSREAL